MSNSSDTRRALIVHAAKAEGGKIRISLDDVIEDRDSNNTWNYDVHVTAKEFDAEVYESLALSEKELADFGHYVFARLQSYDVTD